MTLLFYALISSPNATNAN